MKNINVLNIPDAVKQEIEKTDSQYRRFIKVMTDIVEVTDNTIVVRVEQFDKVTDNVFSQKELIEKAREVFSHLPDGYELRIRPLVFKGTGIDAVSASWVRSKLKKLEMDQSDLVDLLKIDKHVISKLMNNKYEFTRWHKAAFYYLFKTVERNQGE